VTRDDYHTYLGQAAERLVALPQTLLSTITGWAFRQLGPEAYSEVRAGAASFDLPVHQVYDDLFDVLGTVARRRSARMRAQQVARRQVAALTLLRFNVTLPYRWKRLRGPDPEAPPDCPDTADPPVASIVLLSFNRLDYLRTTLFSLCQTVQRNDLEVIAVDNGSTDGSREFLEDALQRGWISKALLLDANLGNASGYNRGFALAHPDSRFLMKLDSDIKLLTPGWLEKSIEFLDGHTSVGFVALNLVNLAPFSALPMHQVDEVAVADFGEWTAGGAMLIPRRTLDTLGRFAEDPGRTYVSDDVTYYARAARAGFRCYHLMDLKAFHQGELDRTRYRPYQRSKNRGEAYRRALASARAMDRGDEPVTLPPPGAPEERRPG
jgi:GT2 family glycosyltransferase